MRSIAATACTLTLVLGCVTSLPPASTAPCHEARGAVIERGPRVPDDPAEARPQARIGGEDAPQGVVHARRGDLVARAGSGGHLELVFNGAVTPLTETPGGTVDIAWDGERYAVAWADGAGALFLARFSLADGLSERRRLEWLEAAVEDSRSRPGIFGIAFHDDRIYLSAAARTDCLHPRVCKKPEHWRSAVAWVEEDGTGASLVWQGFGTQALTVHEGRLVGVRDGRVSLLVGCP